MPTAIIELPDGRRAQLEGPSREAIMQQAQRLTSGEAFERARRDREAGLPLLPNQRALLGAEGRSLDEFRQQTGERLTLPFGLGSFEVGGPLASATRAASNVDQDQSLPLVGATIGSLAAPPLAAGAAVSRAPMILNLLSRAAQRFGPPVAAAGAGGAAGGAAAESDDPEATPASIGQAALRSGSKMAGAELMGLGIGGAASRLFAPNLGRFADPFAPVRGQLREFINSVPSRVRPAVQRVEEALPETARTSAAGLRETAQRLNKSFRRLVSQDTAEAALPAARNTAERAAKALGRERAKRFGFENSGAREFLFRVISSGDDDAIRRLSRMSKRKLDDVRALTLETLIRRSSREVNGERVLDGAQLRSLWNELPESARTLFPKSARQTIEGLSTFGEAIKRAGRFASSPVGGEVLEAAMTPAAFALGGPAVGVPLLLAKAALNPGLLSRYLSRSKLPPEVVQVIGGQAVRTEARRGLLSTNEDDQ